MGDLVVLETNSVLFRASEVRRPCTDPACPKNYSELLVLGAK